VRVLAAVGQLILMPVARLFDEGSGGSHRVVPRLGPAIVLAGLQRPMMFTAPTLLRNVPSSRVTSAVVHMPSDASGQVSMGAPEALGLATPSLLLICPSYVPIGGCIVAIIASNLVLAAAIILHQLVDRRGPVHLAILRCDTALVFDLLEARATRGVGMVVATPHCFEVLPLVGRSLPAMETVPTLFRIDFKLLFQLAGILAMPPAPKGNSIRHCVLSAIHLREGSILVDVLLLVDDMEFLEV